MAYDILSITAWSTWPRTAEFYQSKRFPRAFVVGDAAHAFPPTGGLGVNTGIADAQNLAWKINAVERGWASKTILSTYGNERRPIAVANAHQSVKNQVKLRSLKAALRDPPADKTSLDWTNWKAKLDDEIRVNAEHFDSIRLQIGYVYGDQEVSDEPCDRYIPSCQPGSRLPHTWITFQGRRASILDLVDGTGFVLFTDSDSSSILSATSAKNLSVAIHTFSIDSEFSIIDHSWVDTMRLTPGTGLLVRPDQHIMGHVSSEGDVEVLLRALSVSEQA